MLRNKKQLIFAIAAAALSVAPLVWLQSQTLQYHSDRQSIVYNGIATASGWPYPARISLPEGIAISSAIPASDRSWWDRTGLAANVSVLIFVALSFGCLVAYTPEMQISISELLVGVLLIAIVLAIWTSSPWWIHLLIPTISRERSSPPIWAEYILYFAVGAALTTIVRAAAKRFSSGRSNN